MRGRQSRPWVGSWRDGELRSCCGLQAPLIPAQQSDVLADAGPPWSTGRPSRNDAPLVWCSTLDAY